jgi:hypothetical protein
MFFVVWMNILILVLNFCLNYLVEYDIEDVIEIDFVFKHL